MSKPYVQITTRHYFNTEEERAEWIKNCPYQLTEDETASLLNGKEVERDDSQPAYEAVEAQEATEDSPAVEAQEAREAVPATQSTTFELKEVKD